MIDRTRLSGALALVAAVFALACASPPAPEQAASRPAPTGAEPAPAPSPPPPAAPEARVADGHDAVFEHGAVAADHPVASAAGAQMLAAGGNAVDAAVAASFALSVVRPYSCGIGGGGFMVIRLDGDPTHGDVTTAINYRETAPAGVGPDYFRSKPEGSSVRGGHSVATPGTVPGLLYALETYGTLDRRTVMAPAIKAAAEGFAADAHYAATARHLIAEFEANPGWKERFGFVWQRFLREGRVAEGDVILNPEQALALSLIAQSGMDAFTRGPIGDAIARAVAADGGALTGADVAAYTPVEVEPLVREIQGRTFITMPPPSSGGVALLQTLSLLDARGVDLADPPDTIAEIHLTTEALKHAFADRSRFMADPAFTPVPVDRMLDPEQMKRLSRIMVSDRVVRPPAYGTGSRVYPILRKDDSGTSHISVVDAHGGAVACTETINLEFGSLVTVPGFGFCLNDQMDDFTTSRENAFGLRQSAQNAPEPGKRPVSSMSPTIVVDDSGVLAVAGASGGPRIISGTVEALLFWLGGLDAGEAVARPRWHHQWSPDRLDLEPAMLPDPRDRAELTAIGHPLGEREHVGNVQLIGRTPGGWHAASDPRKGGRPAGH